MSDSREAMKRKREIWIAETRPKRGKIRKWRATEFVFLYERQAWIWYGNSPLTNWRITKYIPVKAVSHD